MFENILLWFIIGIAAAYACRNAYRIYKGRTTGCGCDSSCGDSSEPMPQNSIPDIRESKDESSEQK